MKSTLLMTLWFLTVVLCSLTSLVSTVNAEPTATDNSTQRLISAAVAPYKHTDYRISQHGNGDLSYWIYQPTPSNAESAPVILYLHGWSADDPQAYHEMLTHWAKRGYIVVFPKYGGLFNINEYEDNAISAYESALNYLQQSGQLKPQLENTVFAGHSLGSQIAVRMADRYQTQRYQAPKALILHEPAGTHQLKNDFAIDNNLHNIPPDTVLTILLRDDWDTDKGAYPVPATIWHATSHLSRRVCLAIRSDEHGYPPLISDHNGVQSDKVNWWEGARALDAIDWYGYWRSSDAAIDLGFNYQFYPKTVDFTDTYMGRWSDGTPVKPKEPISTERLEGIYEGLK